MIRIFIADDHPIIRHYLRELIGRQPDMEVAGEAADGHAVVSAPDRSSWDVLLLDLSMPRLSGFEVVRRLRAEPPAPRIVVLSMYPEEQYAPQLLAEGVSAYVSKSVPPPELLGVLRDVGGRDARARLSRSRAPACSAAEPQQRLSAREQQVFMRISQGRTVTDIAAELDLTVSTVSTHVTHIKDKLHARSIGDIINYAHRVGVAV